jgi:hypothetical protein
LLPFGLTKYFIRFAPEIRSQKSLSNGAREGEIMKRSGALFPIALALGEITLAPWASAQAQGSREEGPFEIEKCRTIDKPGSYKLVNDLTFSGTTTSGFTFGTCLTITANFVTIDLAGFTITGPGLGFNSTTAIAAQSSSGNLRGIAVRNGSISGVGNGVALSSAEGSIVEGLRVFGFCPCFDPGTGIDANGIVRGNTAVGFASIPSIGGVGISATGIVTGNFVDHNRIVGIEVGQGSTVIGNTATNTDAQGFDIAVTCPSNVTDNTTVNAIVNPAGDVGFITLSGAGCNTTNNVGNVISR